MLTSGRVGWQIEAVFEPQPGVSVMAFADFAVGFAVEMDLQVSAAVIVGSAVFAPGQTPASGPVAVGAVAPSL